MSLKLVLLLKHMISIVRCIYPILVFRNLLFTLPGWVRTGWRGGGGELFKYHYKFIEMIFELNTWIITFINTWSNKLGYRKFFKNKLCVCVGGGTGNCEGWKNSNPPPLPPPECLFLLSLRRSQIDLRRFIPPPLPTPTLPGNLTLSTI